MSKQFERLYQAWVLEFRDRYIRWADPRARPWETTCRQRDGECKTTDENMVLCDHCDAMYGIKCISPPLKRVPTKAWHCPECKPKLKSGKGARMLSAVAEHAAKRRATLGDVPTKKVKQTMFLVKWAGLGYEFCTWETRADINDNRLISEFHKLNNGSPDEADMTEDVIDNILAQSKHINVENAGGKDIAPVVRSQLYAQSRLVQFLKFGGDAIPTSVCEECGPYSASKCKPRTSKIPAEVAECVTDVCFRVSTNQRPDPERRDTSLPPPLAGEYDAIVPITAKGLMMNVGEVNGSVAFLGYRTFPDGSKGPAEIAKVIRGVGDQIVAVDGVTTIGKSFKEVIGLLRESGKNKFAYMRFLESRFSSCDNELASVGIKGRFAFDQLRRKFSTDRQRVLVERVQNQDVIEDQEVDEDEKQDDSTAEVNEDSENESGDEGEFRPDSDDEELAASNESPVKVEMPTDQSLATGLPIVSGPAIESTEDGQDILKSLHPDWVKAKALREESTRSLAYRLLGIDVGYDSDEGGDADCAYFLDGVDQTFGEAPTSAKPKKGKGAKKGQQYLPARQNDMNGLGDRAKLLAAISLTSKAPAVDDFASFPARAEKPESDTSPSIPSPTKPVKRSTVKVEQVTLTTGEVVHVWSNVEAAAATLQLPLPALRQVLRGEYDEEIGDEVGGFKWRYALAGAKVTAGAPSSSRGGGGRKAKEAWLEFRDKLYDPSEPHIYKNANRLRDYQVDGVNWLASMWYKRQGCVLADEMGLGKVRTLLSLCVCACALYVKRLTLHFSQTVQIVCFIEHIYRVEKLRRPYLVVVPLSTIEHWRREFEGWTDVVCCVYHDRQRIWRDVLREYEWYYEDRPHTADYLKFDVLVTTYDTLIGDFDVISQIPFRVAVVDEAHRLRNQKGRLLECMREISAKGTMHYGFQSRVLMSGTPLQNDLTVRSFMLC